MKLRGRHRCCYLRRLSPTGELSKQLKQHVVQEIGAIARPSEIRFTDSLPKTRSGKIIRRFGQWLPVRISGDTSTLEDRGVLDKLEQKLKTEKAPKSGCS